MKQNDNERYRAIVFLGSIEENLAGINERLEGKTPLVRTVACKNRGLLDVIISEDEYLELKGRPMLGVIILYKNSDVEYLKRSLKLSKRIIEQEDEECRERFEEAFVKGARALEDMLNNRKGTFNNIVTKKVKETTSEAYLGLN